MWKNYVEWGVKNKKKKIWKLKEKIVRSNKCLIGISKEETEIESEAIFKVIVNKNFLKIVR